MKTINCRQLAEQNHPSEIDLIDVRTPVEYRAVHAEGAKNVPLDSLDAARITESGRGHAGRPLYVICQSGARGAKAVQKLMDAGVENAVNVEGGTVAWQQAGLPVKRGKNAISLERQVRIAAGSLTLVGAIAGYFVHPYFIGLPAFIGAGLTFAGITDTCGMGMMLAKMPWNQCGDDSETCGV